MSFMNMHNKQKLLLILQNQISDIKISVHHADVDADFTIVSDTIALIICNLGLPATVTVIKEDTNLLVLPFTPLQRTTALFILPIL